MVSEVAYGPNTVPLEVLSMASKLGGAYVERVGEAGEVSFNFTAHSWYDF
jgi:hypothetical protein